MLKLLVIVAAFKCVIVVSGSGCSRQHEHYVKCIKTCDPQTCDSTDKTYQCPRIGKCKGGCRCKEGYLRNQFKECVRKDQCDKYSEIIYLYENIPKAGKHKVKHLLKGIHKRHHSSAIKVLTGTKRRNYSPISINTTDRPKLSLYKKAQKCNRHEIWSECTNGGCGRRKCSELGLPEIFIDPAKGFYMPGCICKSNYLRNKQDICVPIAECPIPKCSKHEEFVRNMTSVNRAHHCSQFPSNSVENSLPEGPGCICEINYARHYNGTCVLIDDCFN